MKLIQLSEHSEPKPYILKANYNLETKSNPILTLKKNP